MTGQEREAAGFLRKQHFTKVAVTQADLALFRNRTRHAERLQALADDGGRLGGLFHAALERERNTQGIGPGGVFKRDGLHALDDCVDIYALGQAQIAGRFQAAQIVFRKEFFDLGDAAVFSFKNYIVSHWYDHSFLPDYSSRGSIYLAAPSKRPY